MKVISNIVDHRIHATNLLIETTLGEYHKLSNSILEENPFQRKRVKTSGTIYSLLKSDLKEGIVIPPIVLGLNVKIDIKNASDEKLIQLIEGEKNKLLILDGLQRTYTIRDLLKELEDKKDPDLGKIQSHPLRIEIYVGINKLGILYRMLTLNTGQTPMSSRHQIEIIYSDYIKTGIDGVKLIKQVDDKTPSNLGEYNFRDIIDGFTSYLERDYLTIERTDILDNIKSLEKLAIENQNKDLFVQFVKTYDSLASKMEKLSVGWNYDLEGSGKKLGGAAFAKNVLNIFNKSQVMTGFGSAIGKLVDLDAVKGFDEIQNLIPKIKSQDISEDLNNLITKLDSLRSVAVKIGNDQRIFFHYLFREIFDDKSDSYLNFGESVNQAYMQYERRTK
jgi:hypothetical protein